MATITASIERIDECTPLLLAKKGRLGSAVSTNDVNVYSIRLNLQAEVRVEPLRYPEISRAVDKETEAFANDTLQRYLNDAFTSPTRRRLHTVFHKLTNGSYYWDAVRQHRVLTVDHGDAVLSYTQPGQKGRHGLFIPWVGPLLDKFEPAEFLKRRTEVGDAYRAMYKAAFGDSPEEMFEIVTLATAPEKQGLGYGSALVAAVHDMADARGAATFLFTSDAKGFYEAVGYKMVAETVLGLDNPKWTGGPVALRVMLRESTSLSTLEGAEKGL
ncbi:hypothetical protein C8Q80DRAFT_1183823 [Daedaleopsis nitida]|nr:hypothetical protein C8Q80DRAFT_1183823 [Daedaleopsis nitida]